MCLQNSENCEFGILKKYDSTLCGGTEDASVAKIYKTCFGRSKLKLWRLYIFYSCFIRILQNQYIGGSKDVGKIFFDFEIFFSSLKNYNKLHFARIYIFTYFNYDEN
ncbi:hypothetical protein BpHYR1_003049 [Brachionus plicatilis]|uniref:Uncharacterized protein n=1 Tax=Brachionus plicatilis TaxID=10195 RepID=A0A3M7R0I5_BRAPC|nr:hypothetical protein BpHYR1_003049 [Brachionus plicatilis]